MDLNGIQSAESEVSSFQLRSNSPSDFSPLCRSSFIQACAYCVCRLRPSECAVEREKLGGLQRESGMDPKGGRTRTTGNARAKVSSRSSSLPCTLSVLPPQQDECAPVSQGEEEG